MHIILRIYQSPIYKRGWKPEDKVIAQVTPRSSELDFESCSRMALSVLTPTLHSPPQVATVRASGV